MATEESSLGLQHVHVYREYDSFGDLALLSGAPRSASVVAEAGTILIRVERADYNAVLREAALEAVRSRAAFLSSLPVLRELDFPLLMRIASYVKREDHPKGLSNSVLWEGSSSPSSPKGELNDDIVIVQHGQIDVQTNNRRPRTLLTLCPGSCIGALPWDGTMAPPKLLPVLVTSRHSSCTLLRLTRAELAFRAGRRVMLLLELHEATTWLVRFRSPGLLKHLATPAALSKLHASVGSASTPPLRPITADSKCKLMRCGSAPLPIAKSISDEQHTWDLIQWVTAKREELKARVAIIEAKEERRRQENEKALMRARLQQGAQTSHAWQSLVLLDTAASHPWVDLTANLTEGIKGSFRAVSSHSAAADGPSRPQSCIPSIESVFIQPNPRLCMKLGRAPLQ